MESKALKLNGRNVEWKSLNGKQIDNDIVVLENFGNIVPFMEGPIFLAEKVFVINCDKNFVYFWIDETRFPNCKELYLNSHPCDPETFCRKFSTIYLSEKYNKYKNNWASEDDNVIIIKNEIIENLISSYNYSSIF